MVKIDTKRYFRIFYPSGEEMAENMAEELKGLLLQKQKEAPGHAILVLPESTDFPATFFGELLEVQSKYVRNQLSFMITPINDNMKKKYPIMKDLNHTPTLQEAIDMVMMEKLERELINPDDGNERI